MRNTTQKNGAKVGATAIIWSLATGIMAICIPLVNVSRSGIILPVAVIIGVSISTIAVWFSGNQKAVESARIFQQIEQRIRDLEAISSSQDFDDTKRIK
ncbi:conserved hypothetical protein [Hyella patelloides LEGE 07179]|uniref:Uncharacterized protein n=1 Tax=Hyella patelloides LEGE 07179 TaxID=945734 RepID=A0A563VRT4_9CYAN|nr:hypothetical protein [Hyella patelloides]VEP14092.1 conserved hypothetical protein [Hyella patelloides LEGE 07179]